MTENETRATGWPAHRVTGVDVWPYRRRDGTAEFLLLHRSGRDGPPFWQGVSGWIEADEAPHQAALRELREETGLEAAELSSVDAIFDLYKARRGTVEATVPFAALVAPDRDPTLSDEHDAWRWASLPEALTLVPFEPQRAALRRIVADLLDRPGLSDLYRVELPAREPKKDR